MRLLVTNDDGVDAPSMHVLARALEAAGHDLIIAAPDHDYSGAGASIGRGMPDAPIEVGTRDIAGVQADAHAVAGPPALCVMLSRLGGFGPPPEMVVSGINPGSNTGRATLHSGTVGAALTGANFGIPGVAVSLANYDENGLAEVSHWDTAAHFAVAAVEWVISRGDRTVLNVNVPNLLVSEVLGVRAARLAPFGTARAAIVPGQTSEIHLEFQPTDVELGTDTDTALVSAGYVAVTPIIGIRRDPDGDVESAVAAMGAAAADRSR